MIPPGFYYSSRIDMLKALPNGQWTIMQKSQNNSLSLIEKLQHLLKLTKSINDENTRRPQPGVKQLAANLPQPRKLEGEAKSAPTAPAPTAPAPTQGLINAANDKEMEAGRVAMKHAHAIGRHDLKLEVAKFMLQRLGQIENHNSSRYDAMHIRPDQDPQLRALYAYHDKAHREGNSHLQIQLAEHIDRRLQEIHKQNEKLTQTIGGSIFDFKRPKEVRSKSPFTMEHANNIILQKTPDDAVKFAMKIVNGASHLTDEQRGALIHNIKFLQRNTKPHNLITRLQKYMVDHHMTPTFGYFRI